jgi:metallophosphoesterase superfamily enzyme
LPTATAVVADLHLGYDLARQRGGEAVPAVGLGETTATLQRMISVHEILQLVIAGDLVENAAGLELALELQAWLARNGVKLAAVVPGNHDRKLSRLTELPIRPEGVTLGDWQVVHGDGELPRRRRLVHGHFHPWLRWGRANAPCFLMRPQRLVLPAFTPEAHGVQVLHDPRWRRYRCCAVTGSKVLDLGELATLRRRLRHISPLPSS